MKIDFHSHILPDVDDGSRSVEESVKILDKMAEDGVDIVVATPHFYCTKTSIHRFLDKRDRAFESLKPHLKPEHPKILLGAEVLYNHMLVGKEALSRLAIQGTDYMLLEMKYDKITEEMIEDVEVITNDLDVKVIIAHLERYLAFTSMKLLCSLMELDVIGQMNADSLTHLRTKQNCFKLIKGGYVHILGTDTHRIDRGDASLGEGLEVIEKKFGQEMIAEIDANGQKSLADRPVSDIRGWQAGRVIRS